MSKKRGSEAGSITNSSQPEAKKPCIADSVNQPKGELTKERINSIGLEIVTLVVGSEQIHLKVDKSVLVEHGGSVGTAFRGEFQEANSLTMDLPEETPTTASLFIAWLYACVGKKPVFEPAGYSWLEYSLLFLFAEKYLIGELQEAAFRILTNRIALLDDTDSCYDAWDDTKNSKLRFTVIIRFLILFELHTPAHGTKKLYGMLDEDFEFLWDVIVCRAVCDRNKKPYRNVLPMSWKAFRDLWKE